MARNALIARQTITLNAADAAAQLARGAFPRSVTFPAGFSLPRPSINTADDNLVLPYAQQANFGVERELASNWSLAVNYVFVHGVKLLRSWNSNPLITLSLIQSVTCDRS